MDIATIEWYSKYFFLVNSFNKVTKPYIIICSSKLLEFYITYNKQLLHEVRHDIMSNSKPGSELSASVFSFGRWQRHGVWSFKLSWRNQLTNAYLLQILNYMPTSHAFVYWLIKILCSWPIKFSILSPIRSANCLVVLF